MTVTEGRTELEEFYDETLHPLLSKLHELCAEKGMSYIMTFDLGSEKHPGFRATSSAPHNDGTMGKDVYAMLALSGGIDGMLEPEIQEMLIDAVARLTPPEMQLIAAGAAQAIQEEAKRLGLGARRH